jgi:hypothetical protein
MNGTINSIENCGSIVIVTLDTNDGNHPVYFDHRCFQHLLDAEACNPNDLIGRSATFDDGTFSFEDQNADCI